MHVRLGLMLLTLIVVTPVVLAETQAERAARANQQGEAELRAKHYANASQKFREAAARVAEPRYFFNLCTSLDKESKFSQALSACNEVAQLSPTPELAARADKLIAKIQEHAKAAHVDLSRQ
jgi:Flp pilus assembly protein TadD